jgi:predicted phage tail protein
MKKISFIIIILSSICIVISQLIVLINNSIVGEKMFAISFIGIGIGSIILGVNQLLNRKEKA